jgi:hypothetical protein
MVSRYYKGTPSEPGPTDATRRVPIKNRAHWRVIVEYDVAEMLKPYELYLDHANQLWVQAVTGKKWLLPLGTYSIEAHIRPGAVIHPLTRKRLS